MGPNIVYDGRGVCLYMFNSAAQEEKEHFHRHETPSGALFEHRRLSKGTLSETTRGGQTF